MTRCARSAWKRIASIGFLVGLCFFAGMLGPQACRALTGFHTVEPPCGLARSDAPDDGMTFIRGGRFPFGAAGIYAEEGPVEERAIGDFWISRHDVTNTQFARFVRETGYVTVAERGADPRDYPGMPAEGLVPGGAVFRMPSHSHPGVPLKWWDHVPGANGRHPEGPDSDIRGRENHPVVQVAYEDSAAFARWVNMELPTEAQWEFAARGGFDGQLYPWGAQPSPGDRPMANTWQGEFPLHNTGSDGFATTSPVGCFPANGLGLYDMVGNVWQWTSDWCFTKHRAASAAANSAVAVQSGDSAQSLDPENPQTSSRVIKGGSFLCASNYCVRYRPAARQPHDAGLSTNHIGFRTVRNGAEPSASRPVASR